MSVIVPAILPTSLTDLEEKLAKLDGSGSMVRDVQIDVVDGRFASPACWPYTPGGMSELADLGDHGERLSHGGAFKLEIDLMVSDPSSIAGAWIAAGASRLVVHAGSVSNLHEVIEGLEQVYGYDHDFSSSLLTLGLAIHPAADSALIEPYLDRVDFVQFMGIDQIGKQGQCFDHSVLQKIRSFRKKHPKMPIQVDGGVSQITAPALLAAGVGRLIVGSDLWRAPNLVREMQTLESLAEQFGTYE